MTVCLVACGGNNQNGNTIQTNVESVPPFSCDSAMAHIKAQCAFGARVPGSEAHRLCGDYIVEQFKRYGAKVVEQKATVTAWNGDRLPMRNIIASLNPESENRILFSAHWDSRPWADADADENNHHTPVIAANDGASGVAVMLEMCRVLADKDQGIDFICFDTEDYGVAEWADKDDSESWCLGSQYWSVNPHEMGYRALFGVNLDMVGGRGARFYKEGFSKRYAESVVDLIWHKASQLGYGHIFMSEDGGYITDDHIYVIRYGIPCADIIPSDPQHEFSFCEQWHTVHDTLENIDPHILEAVGRTMCAILQ